MTLWVGLTGGIGSGKSTVCRLFSALGVPIIDADEVAREVVARGQPALASIAREFGEEMLDGNGQLHRERLRSLVFRDPESRKRLEAILHPLINETLFQRAKKIGAPYCIICIPLLLETGAYKWLHRILVVDTPIERQIARVMRRDNASKEEVAAIMRTQASRESRRLAADDILYNDSDLANLAAQVETLHRKYLAFPTPHQEV